MAQQQKLIHSLYLLLVIYLVTIKLSYSFVLTKQSFSRKLELYNSQQYDDIDFHIFNQQQHHHQQQQQQQQQQRNRDDELLVSNDNLLSRRMLLRSTTIAGLVVSTGSSWDAFATDEEVSSDSYESIAALAGRIQREVDATNPLSAMQGNGIKSDKTAYDFTLPIRGVPTKFGDIIRQDYTTETLLSGSTVKVPKVKAIIVVNMKQDDPVARRAIPELIALAAKYGRGDSSQLAIIASPTDQGYYEPDTSQLIRLKLESEYGYGINPSTIVTDKVNFLGTGAVPFWRWVQSTCRTPAGLGRIEGNFEKFLIDGRTGLPVRRYPRKYQPSNMVDDIEALIAGRPIPPARANYLEEWRTAAAEAERDTYRFEKGLNVFDQ